MKKNKISKDYTATTIYDYFPSKSQSDKNQDDHDTYYGLKHTTKASNVTRLWFTNPCGIGVDPLHPKSDTSFSFLKNTSKCDIFGLAETNVHWYMLYNHASLYARVKRRWKNFKLSTSHNKHEKLGKTQRGGTCTVALNQIAFREHARGQDSTGLGRWSWIELRGKDDHKTRIYTAYRPGGKPQRTKTAHTTVYEQHERYIRAHHGEQIDPRKFFDLDLLAEIENILQTTNVVLMIDVNQNVEKGDFSRRMEEIGMHNIFCRLGMPPMPATHHRGRYPISTIYVSDKLQPIRAGILPKTIGVQGDHRNIYVDITNDSLLGVYMYKVISQPMKRLQLRDSRIVKKYQKHMLKHLSKNNMLSKGLILLEDAKYPSTEQLRQRMEGFDDQLGRAIQHGKSKCRKFCMGDIPFSKSFEKLRDTRRLWLLTLKRKIGQKISSTTIRRLAKKLRVNSPLSFSLQAVKENFKQAEKEYRSLNRQTAQSQRNAFNEQLAAANAINMNTSKEKILKRIIYDEQVREQTRLSRRYFPKKDQASQRVDRVQHLENGKWIEESSPRMVAKACQLDTEAKYKETENTPLMKKDIHELLGNFAETKFSNQYMKGNATLPSTTSRWTNEMMEKIKFDKSIPRITIAMSPKDIKNVWKVVKEHKASAPSGRYNGTYKAMCDHKELLQILTISMNLPFFIGTPYKRWHSMVDIMAFKKRDNIKVSNIRSIIISEADWNAAGRVQVTRRLMKQAENHKLLPQEHMGGRKGRKSIDGVLTKRLVLDNSRISHTPLIIISTDAANCYDRMLHKYISFICIKWGLAVQVMIALLQPLQKATHHTRTAFGDTHAEFTGHNLQGAGQGNTGAAPYWTAISTPVIELMKDYKMQASFQSPLSGIIVVLTLLAFVDDTELFLTANANEDTKDLMKKAEIAINLWREFLYVTGGVMRSSKCSWTLMDYKGSLHKSTLLRQKDNKGEIRMPDEDGTINIVPRYDIDVPRTYLGVVQTTDGEEKEQEEVMFKKIQEWNNNIQQSRLPPALNLRAVMSKIHRSLMYPLPALTISETSLQKMSNTLYWQSLPKCGIVRTFPKSYRDLPSTFQGLGLPNLYLEQEVGKLMQFITFAYTDSVVWKQMELGLEILQVRIGTQTIIFDYDYDQFAALCPDCWIKSLWKFLSKMKLKLRGWKNERPKMKRQGDQYIMEEIVKCEPEETDLNIINECRIYLQIETLSDMVNGAGSAISSCYYLGRRDENRASKIKWQKVRRPNINKWLIWQKYLDRLWCKDKSQRLLREPLGQWTTNPSQTWNWFYDSDKDTLFYIGAQEKLIKVFTQSHLPGSNRHKQPWFKCVDIIVATPQSLIRIRGLSLATVCVYDTRKAKMDGWSKIKIPIQPSPKKNTFIQHLHDSKIPKWMICRHNFAKFHNKLQIQQFLEDPVMIVTDASVKQAQGTACIIIENTKTREQMIYITKVPANLHEEQSNDSYRSELCGIWAAMKVFLALEKYTDRTSSIQLACDNLRALELAETYQYIKTSQQHFDIARATIATRDKLESRIEYVHVRGHMDKKKKYEDLNRLEQLNVLCDKYAKEANVYLSPTGPKHVDEEGISVWDGEKKIYKDFKQRIRDVFWTNRSMNIVSSRYKWSYEQFHDISWKSSRRAMDMMTTSMRIRISKVVTNTLPVGQVMETRKQWNESFCPRCGCNDEHPHHVLQCPDKGARKILKSSLQSLEKILVRLQTEKNLQTKIISRISSWITQSPIIPGPTDPYPILDQIRLGWSHFMEGRVHVSFEKYMEEHYRKIGSKKRGHLWVSVVIQTLWTKIFSPMWDHRNTAVHKSAKKDKNTREQLNLNFTIRLLYSQGAERPLLFQDKHLLQETLSSLLKSPTGRKKGWILSMQLALGESEKAVAAENLHMRNSMRAFRETGTCRICTPTIKRRVQPRSRRKRLPPLLQRRVKRKRDESMILLPKKKKKRFKRHPLRKKPSMYLDRMKRNALPTIEEEWEKKHHVRKKVSRLRDVESLFGK